MNDQWAGYKWPEWIPEPVRERIAGYWSTPAEWIADAEWEVALPLGSRIELCQGPRLPGRPARFVHFHGDRWFFVRRNGAFGESSSVRDRGDNRRLTLHEWESEGVQRFGPNGTKWVFRCPVCSNLQSAESVHRRNPAILIWDAEGWVHTECEGLHTDGVGCYWKAVQFCAGSVAVLKDRVWHPVFEFGDSPL